MKELKYMTPDDEKKMEAILAMGFNGDISEDEGNNEKIDYF